MHYDQQPLAIRRNLFRSDHLDSSNDWENYLNWWDSKFAHFFAILHQCFAIGCIPALSSFYNDIEVKKLYDFETTRAHFGAILKMVNPARQWDGEFEQLFQPLGGKIIVTTEWLNELENEFTPREAKERNY